MLILDQNQQICPYYSPENRVIPQYIIMEPGDTMELSNKIANHFIFVISGDISISFNQYINRPILEDEMFFLPKNNSFKWKANAYSTLILTGYNTATFPCTGARAGVLYKIKSKSEYECRGVKMKKKSEQ